MTVELPEPGTVLGGEHRLDAVVGEGGFGRVYRATTLKSGRDVAIKVLKPGQDGYQEKRAARFMRELRTIARLEEPTTVTLYDFGKTEDGLLYMVCEYVDGEDLSDVLHRRGRLSEPEVAHVLRQVLVSLREAHQRNLLHRDIKPANIRVFEYGGDPLRVKVLDFGLAKSLAANESPLTAKGKVVGTPRYMAPEQLLGEDLSAATDIYSLGLVAYELLMGPSSTLMRGLMGRPRQLRISKKDGVSDTMRRVVNRMLSKDRAERYPSAQLVLNALRFVPPPDFENQPARDAASTLRDTDTLRDIQGPFADTLPDAEQTTTELPADDEQDAQTVPKVRRKDRAGRGRKKAPRGGAAKAGRNAKRPVVDVKVMVGLITVLALVLSVLVGLILHRTVLAPAPQPVQAPVNQRTPICLHPPPFTGFGRMQPTDPANSAYIPQSRGGAQLSALVTVFTTREQSDKVIPRLALAELAETYGFAVETTWEERGDMTPLEELCWDTRRRFAVVTHAYDGMLDATQIPHRAVASFGGGGLPRGAAIIPHIHFERFTTTDSDWDPKAENGAYDAAPSKRARFELDAHRCDIDKFAQPIGERRWGCRSWPCERAQFALCLTSIDTRCVAEGCGKHVYHQPGASLWTFFNEL